MENVLVFSKSGFDNEYGKIFLKKLINDVKKLGGEIVLIDDKRKYPSRGRIFSFTL